MKKIIKILVVLSIFGILTVSCTTSAKYLMYSPDLTEENAAIFESTYKYIYKGYSSVETTLLEIKAINGKEVNWPKRNITALIPEGVHDVTFFMSYYDGSRSITGTKTITIPMRKGEKIFVSCEGGLRIELGSLKVAGSYFDLTTNGIIHRFESRIDGTEIHWFDPSDKYGDTNGTFVLTDIPEKYNGKYARLFFLFVSDDTADDVDVIDGIEGGAISKDVSFIKLAKITNGSVHLPLFDLSEDIVRYSGSHTGELAVEIYNDKTTVLTFDEIENDISGIAQVCFKNITLSNGIVTKSANDGIILEE